MLLIHFTNPKRGTGILNNELYIGKLVWNRQRFIKDPQTGKPQARPNPEAEWIIKDVPELRIITQDLWDKVKAHQEGRKIEHTDRGAWERRKPRFLLTGLVKCGCCGGGFPGDALTPFGIDVQHPDEFLVNHLHLAPGMFCASVRKVRARLKNPPYSVEDYLSTLTQIGLVATAAELAGFAELL